MAFQANVECIPLKDDKDVSGRPAKSESSPVDNLYRLCCYAGPETFTRVFRVVTCLVLRRYSKELLEVILGIINYFLWNSVVNNLFDTVFALEFYTWRKHHIRKRTEVVKATSEKNICEPGKIRTLCQPSMLAELYQIDYVLLRSITGMALLEGTRNLPGLVSGGNM